MDDLLFLIFLIGAVLLVSFMFIYWLRARKRMFDSFDKYQKMAGEKHPRDFRN